MGNLISPLREEYTLRILEKSALKGLDIPKRDDVTETE
jgi:hypothetical protein